ncbi:MAG: hypothetical protein NZ455_03090 [Bacteroidia bacterium]|nr:hypothetical protein [Bacteroidia bacterium]MDW8345512.1 hypothetical protein [Bacteroidia bacterium]
MWIGLFQRRNSIVPYLFLLVFAIILRIPSLDKHHILTDEASYYVCAQRVVEQGKNYTDAWDNKPPLIVGLYSFMYRLFGTYSLKAVKIMSILWIYITALLITDVVNNFRLLPEPSLLPAYFYIILSSIPWNTQELNAELLMNLPITISLFYLIKYSDDTGQYDEWLFPKIGLCLFFAVWFRYQAITHVIGVLAAYIIVFAAKPRHLFEVLFFLILPMIIYSLVRIITGHWSKFWDIGILYNLDYILIGRNPFEHLSVKQSIWDILRGWNILLILGFWGFLLWYFGNVTYNVQKRKGHTIIVICAFTALIGIFLGIKRLYFHYILQTAPFLSIFLSVFFLTIQKEWVRYLSWILVLAVVIFNLSLYLVIASPEIYRYFSSQKIIKSRGWVSQQYIAYHDLSLQWTNLEKIVHLHSEPEERILILAYHPEWYVKLNRKCATYYTNFSIAYYKIDFFKHNQNRTLISAKERLADVYEALEKDTPALFIDEYNLFPEIQYYLPNLLKKYRKVPTSIADVYVRVK